MGVIYLQHPIHGIHVATTDAEVAICKASGWTDWSVGDPDPVLSPRLPIPDTKAAAKDQESEVEILKAQMAALLKRLDAAEAKDDEPEVKPSKKAAPAAPAVPDFLKPQG